MKNYYIFTVLVFLLSFSPIYATIHTVSNVVTVDADFTNITDATTAAAAGDTIHIFGSPFNYGGFTINKQLHFIGPGYLLEENGVYETGSDAANVGDILLNAAATHTVIEGLRIGGSLEIKCGNVIARKNWFTLGSYLPSIKITNSIDTCYIYNNLFTKFSPSYRCVSTSGTLASVKNIYIANNILQGSVSMTDVGDNTGSRFVVNNTFSKGTSSLDTEINGVVAMNNIFLHDIATNGTFPGIFQDNLFTGDFPTQAIGNGNVTGINPNLILQDDGVNAPVDHELTDLLPEPNPASENCGTAGCGATYGVNPHYRLSGIPEVPLLYHLTADNTPDASGMLNVTVKAKAY